MIEDLGFFYRLEKRVANTIKKGKNLIVKLCLRSMIVNIFLRTYKVYQHFTPINNK